MSYLLSYKTMRVKYLDGLRGVACLQVVIYHYACAFWPGVPLGVFANGACAVALFFLISGYVLTGSFERAPAAIPSNIGRRAVRLALPAIAAVIISVPLEVIGHHDAQMAAHITGSGILQMQTAAPPLTGLLPDITGVSVLFGYAGASLLPPAWLPNSAMSLDVPLWTLSLEFFGSIWIMMLVGLRRFAPIGYGLALLASLYVIGTNVLLLFTLGHLCSVLARQEPVQRFTQSPGARLVGWLVLGAGLMINSGRAYHPDIWIPPGVFAQNVTFNVQIECGCILIFLGVLLLAPLQDLLDRPVTRTLGRLSFSIYLLHWPIMVAVGSAVFLVALPVSAHLAAAVAFGVGLLVTLGLAFWFERYVDAPAVRLSRRIGFSGRVQAGSFKTTQPIDVG